MTIEAHLNIDFMFLEDQERVPSEDTLHVVRGVVASRPGLHAVDDAGVDDAPHVERARAWWHWNGFL